MYKYKIVEKNEEDPMQSLIEKSGGTVTFNGHNIVDHIVHTRKVLRETIAQIEIEDKQNQMIEEMIPQIKDLPEDKMQLIMAYAARKVQRPESILLKETCEETIKSYEEQVELINKQTGLKIELPIESPYQNVKANEETRDSGIGADVESKE